MPTNRWWILASGPSLTKSDVDKLKGEKVCVINTTYQIAPWADILYACDQSWWEWDVGQEAIRTFQGQKWTQTEAWNKRLPELNYIESKSGSGLAMEGAIYQGSNSGIQAINLIYQLYKPEIIYLLGYDMKGTKENAHWHAPHPNHISSPWDSWVGLYNQVAADAERLGVQIINCSRETALTCFPRQSLEEVLTA